LPTQWDALLRRALASIQTLEDSGFALRYWTFGGGTVLMLRLDHRDSKDIDLFVTDPQVLGYLSPRLAGETVWNTDDYDESANALKLRYNEGEIDIIVAASISDLAPEPYAFDGSQVRLEHPEAIILKKLIYRAADLKPRDIFDTAVVLSSAYGDVLRDRLSLVSDSKARLFDRIAAISDRYFDSVMDELDIHPDWHWIVPLARQMVVDMVAAVPDPRATNDET
jgi:hypothetical protein